MVGSGHGPFYLAVCLSKTTKPPVAIFSWTPNQDLNQEKPDYEAGLLLTRPPLCLYLLKTMFPRVCTSRRILAKPNAFYPEFVYVSNKILSVEARLAEGLLAEREIWHLFFSKTFASPILSSNKCFLPLCLRSCYINLMS